MRFGRDEERNDFGNGYACDDDRQHAWEQAVREKAAQV
jgi:hypothetical protein